MTPVLGFDGASIRPVVHPVCRPPGHGFVHGQSPADGVAPPVPGQKRRVIRQNPQAAPGAHHSGQVPLTVGGHAKIARGHVFQREYRDTAQPGLFLKPVPARVWTHSAHGHAGQQRELSQHFNGQPLLPENHDTHVAPPIYRNPCTARKWPPYP